MDKLKKSIEAEIAAAGREETLGELGAAFRRLERAHVLGQADTWEHTRVHWRMLKLGFRMGSWREVFGQVIRIFGATTKTPFGIYPAGNTGGSNVWFFKRMPVPDDLQDVLENARSG